MASARSNTRSTAAPRSPGRVVALGWSLLAALLLFAVLLINGVPLFYHDTAGYFGHGDGIFRVLGLFQPEITGSGPAAADPTDGDGIVIGSRSAIYAVFLTFLTGQVALWAPALGQAALLAFTTWLTAHLALRMVPHARTATRLTAWMLIAATLGSAGFYVAYLMPDIFAPILLLCMAALVAFASVTGFLAALILTGLAITAVVMHPSHLAIALVLLLPCLLVGYLFQTGRMWRTLLLLLLIPAAGIGERQVFNFAVERASDGANEVVYLPFFTARLISDGPGLAFLEGVCPTPEWATCDLHARLHSAEQLSPDRILFSTVPETGSFNLLSAEQRRDIAFEQREFLRAVLLSRPLDVVIAAMGNMIEQLGLVSPWMTLPNPAMVTAVTTTYPAFSPELAEGRLVGDRPGWMAPLTRVHEAYYLLAGAALLGLIFLPGNGVHIHLRVFGLLIIAGLLANAFVTGAISQPADRYGARVIFLLPMTTVLLLALRSRRPKPEPQR